MNDMMTIASLKNKKALITAAAQGIGKATAEMLSKQGVHVIATDINEEKLNTLENVDKRVLDVTNQDAVKALSDDIGAIDILFNCAGFVHNGTILECSSDDWDFTMSLNVKSMYMMIQAFLPSMVSSGGGSIINMSSVASSIKGVPNRFVYSTSKAAIIGLTKSVAMDFVQDNIRCNAVCPGTVDTPSLHDRLEATGDYDDALRKFIARQPMGRLATADDIAKLVCYLASNDSSFITGQAYVIDGGWAI